MLSAYPLYRIAQWVNHRLPGHSAFRLAERLADVQWRSSPKDRAAVCTNLTRALKQSVLEDSPLVREVFRNFARYLVEFLNAHSPHQASIIVEGGDEVLRAMASHNGTGHLILSGHLGNWELGAIMIRRLGVPLSSVVLPHRDPLMNRLFDGQRRRFGVDPIPLGMHASQRCLQLLRDRRALAILGDREFGPNGLPVDFLGHPVPLPRGPAILSLRTGAPLIPVFLIREGIGRFRFYVEPPIRPVRAPSTHQSVQALIQRYAQVIEQYIRRFPSQWLMFQPL